MRIHDPATNDIPIGTPDGWPEINVSGFQTDFSIDDKVPAEKLTEFLKASVSEIVSHFDPLLVILPLVDPEIGYFKRAVYQLAYSRLIPELPVNRQHKSEPQEVTEIKKRMTFFKQLSLENQQKITGFVSSSIQSTISSELL